MKREEKVIRDDIHIVEHRVKEYLCDVAIYDKRVAGYKASLKRLRATLRALYKRLKEML